MRCTNATVQALGFPATQPLIYGTSVVAHLQSKGCKLNIKSTTGTLADALKTFKTGKFYVFSAGHAMAIVDGILTDTYGYKNKNRVKVIVIEVL